jgi:hypothetical protein
MQTACENISTVLGSSGDKLPGMIPNFNSATLCFVQAKILRRMARRVSSAL